MFELQRRGALLFELNNQRQEYEQVILRSECLGANPQAQARVDRLRGIAKRVQDILARKDAAPVDELLLTRDEVVTTGSDLVLELRRRGVLHRCPFTRVLQHALGIGLYGVLMTKNEERRTKNEVEPCS